VTIRRARPGDARELTALAHAAKRHWRYPARWIRRWRSDLTVTAAFVARHPVYCALRDGEVLGFYALSRARDAGELELEHMWVRPDLVRAGVGRALFAHLVRRMRTLRATRLRIVSDPNAEGFYRRMGAVRVGAAPSLPRGRRLPVLVFRPEGHGLRRGRGYGRGEGGPMIRKLSSGQYRLYSKKRNPKTGRRRNLGTFKSRAAAQKHERAVQYFKRGG